MSRDANQPRYHFTPPQNWMNDPNGLVHLDGEYHLFYQHNPYGTAWGHMSWGHAVSSDLVHWDHLPIAIYEQPEAGYTIFSGSAVIDRANTSGFGLGDTAPMVAVFTADHRACDPPVQNIHIAYSLDGGRTFAEYAGNPVIDVGERKFGDPKVFWHAATRQWIMVNISGLGQGHVVFYGSRDLKTWTYLSDFQAPDVAPGVWECPDLFPLPLDGHPSQIRWVLKTNCVTFGGGPSGTRYFVGDFDGITFTNAAAVGETLTSDEGVLYAEVTYNDAPGGRRVLVGWLRQQPHEGRGWTGAQSVPRLLTLHSVKNGYALYQRPVPELDTFRGRRWVVRDQPLTEEVRLEDPDLSSRALDVRVVLDLRHAVEGGVRLGLGDGRIVTIGINSAASELFVALGDGRRVTTACAVEDGTAVLQVLFDQDILEAFGGDTSAVTTNLPYGHSYEHLSVYGTGVAPHLVRADVWTLDND
jgi:fructan beta-fructosidase